MQAAVLTVVLSVSRSVACLEDPPPHKAAVLGVCACVSARFPTTPGFAVLEEGGVTIPDTQMKNVPSLEVPSRFVLWILNDHAHLALMIQGHCHHAHRAARVCRDVYTYPSVLQTTAVLK